MENREEINLRELVRGLTRFLKTYLLWMSLAAIIGAGIAYLISRDHKEIYRSKAVYNLNQTELKIQVMYFRDLGNKIDEGDLTGIARELNISKGLVASINELSVTHVFEEYGDGLYLEIIFSYFDNFEAIQQAFDTLIRSRGLNSEIPFRRASEPILKRSQIVGFSAILGALLGLILCLFHAAFKRSNIGFTE